jgi:hypothetical protein
MVHETPPKKASFFPLIAILLGGVAIGVVGMLWTFLSKKPSPPPEFMKIEKQHYQGWKAICDTMISEDKEGKILGKAKEFLPDFIQVCQQEKQKLQKIWGQHKMGQEDFLRICRSMGMARTYFQGVEKQRVATRSVFPVELLPKDYTGPMPKKDPVLSEKDYANIAERNPILSHNLRLYEEYQDEIEGVVEKICSPKE